MKGRTRPSGLDLPHNPGMPNIEKLDGFKNLLDEWREHNRKTEEAIKQFDRIAPARRRTK